MMDFIDWCGHVLNSIIEIVNADANLRSMGVGEQALAQRLFGEERYLKPDFHHSTQRAGMLDAVRELESAYLIEDRGHRFYLPTPRGKNAAKDIISLWQQICGVTLDNEHAQLLGVINQLSEKPASDHAMLLEVTNEPVLAELQWKEGDDLLWAVSQELERIGFINRHAFMGGKLELSATYLGLVWERKRRMFNKCDVFISHITGESQLALKLKSFLVEAFGEDLKIFVSSDYKSIGGGRLWFLEIVESIKAAPVTLVLLSGSSVDRRWINFEAGVGVGAGNLVIPLVHSGFSKDDVGLPLSPLQVRSLDDSKDVEGVLSDIAERAGRDFGVVDAAAFVTHSQASGGAKLEASVNHVPVKVYDGYKEHSLKVGLVNKSSKTLNSFRVEVEVPNVFTNQSTTYTAEVEGRRTQHTRYFRAESKDRHIKTLFPGDRIQEFFKIDLIIPSDSKDGADFERQIVVMVFAGDTMTQKQEMSVRELLAKEPSFG